MRVGVRVAVVVHVRDQSGEGSRGQVGTQGPRRVDVPHTPRQVGHVFEHVLLEHEPVLRFDLRTVDAQRDPAEGDEVVSMAILRHVDVTVDEARAYLAAKAAAVLDAVDRLGALADLGQRYDLTLDSAVSILMPIPMPIPIELKLPTQQFELMSACSTN